jgi:hypothetical protein
METDYTRNFEAFGVGSALSRAFSTLSRNFGVFLSINLVFVVAVTLVELLLPDRGGRAPLGSFISLLLLMISQGATIYGVFQSLRGKPVSFVESLSRGLRRSVFSLLVFLMFVFLFVLFTVPAIILMGLYSPTSAWYFLFLGVNVVAVVLVVALLCRWSVTIPVCIVERLGPVRSMKRSSHLTQGHRLKIFALGLLTIVIPALTFRGVSNVLVRVPILVALVQIFLRVFFQSFGSVVYAVTYYDLRTSVEGISIENLADVFE